MHLDNALERTFNLDPCVIVYQVSRIETSHFCIIKCSKDTNTPRYVAEVVSNNSDNNTVKVQWWAPNAIAKQKGGKYHNMAFEACTTKHRVQKKQRGALQWHLKPHIDSIQYNTVYFGISKMTCDRRLPAEVKRKLRGLSLVSKNIKIKRLLLLCCSLQTNINILVTLKFMATLAPICQQQILFLACPGIPFTRTKNPPPRHTPFGMLDTCSSTKLDI